MKHILLSVLWLLIVVTIGGWAVLMLIFSPGLPEAYRLPISLLVGVVLVLSLLPSRFRRTLRLVAVVMLLSAGALWSSIAPSNTREWVDDVAQTPWAEIKGDEVVFHNVRHFTYRSETDYDRVYEDRTVNLRDLSEVDILASYWAGKSIAHIMVSFGFKGTDFLSFSIETRKEKGESYSPIKGFFRNYELSYVVADERDVVALRTNHRDPHEQVYLLRTRIALENGRKLLINYANMINDLKENPRFYNTLTGNCTTQVLTHVWALGSKVPYNWKILLSGYVPEYLADNDVLMSGMGLDEIMARSLVNERARHFESDPLFSVRIRETIPHPSPREVPVANSSTKAMLGEGVY